MRRTPRAGHGRVKPAGEAVRRPVHSCRVLVDGTERALEMNLAESPLAWLALRKGRDGAPLIAPAQLAAGERLRCDFTRAGLTPRVTTNWSAAGRGGGIEAFSDVVLAAKARVNAALAAVGPELSGVLLDVCCFLKGLEAVEQERGWPARTGKVVLGLGLDRLAAHYGLASVATGRRAVAPRAWRAEAGGDG
ncbi:DUF6456 domain-containing protein [Aquabacter spiritensis]|uniref:DUF6456 domain-containing protein n=1 Tax=Aquabacter spiritensis TaxID=933073 RepID=A0A4R3LWE1_9HYPH|nr:DUF6456 domain-containing protein [Aquabacter spiritensis]TCT02975.1 hypothetical protein EDC64_111147 [Aquabacter spiritensis]